ncbi:hypothetical protein QBC35DRAFT_373531 [Podospora australis]|uniref:EGF-like domain-containing protein n=1 Tax=Podospora australis TaxID=1536484 RepID=A0AAN6X2A4_9PEZI|nr:hypothetical protein QBC35DRAFT_373531 [Podospora australis]
MNSQDGRDMDRPPPAGSVKRARERAAAGLPRSPPRAMAGRLEEEPEISRPTRPQAPPGLQTKDGQIGVAISRPTQVPQWPLAGPIIAPPSVDGEPYRPPPGRSQPPQRPPRPSRVPSMLDSSKVQDHTPVFQYRPRSGRESTGQELLPVPETSSSLSRQSSTQSSVGSIPDFPIPVQIPPGPPRRSVNLGPPPSARRGASSFYSNASFVSPIPEESPRSRSHTSFASSAAIPESWGTPSPGPSPQYPEAYYDDIIIEETSPFDDEEEDSRLVRNASVGKMAKPTLVSAQGQRSLESVDEAQRPNPTPIQTGPFKNGTGYVENSSSSSTIPTTAMFPIGSAIAAEDPINVYFTTSSDEKTTPSDGETLSSLPPGARPYSRLSAVRRPPRLDMDAVRKAESRGSLTSLPDLIRRATRLAASLEKGRRPASRFVDDNDYYASDELGGNREKHQSGLSDMLAAFPPPAQPGSSSRRSIRNSIREQVQSWPLPMFNRSANTSREAVPNGDSQHSQKYKPRRCCGLPLWGFIVVMIVVLILIAAAVVIPVEFLVIRKQNTERNAQASLEQCQRRLVCANGGTNIVNQEVCSCICSNGFTGNDCTVAPSPGCATITLGDATNVTVGDAIPRLIEQAQANFSVPLSGTAIIAKLNTADMSCSATNALVTFDGRSTREGTALAQVAGQVNANAVVINGVAYTTITIAAGQSTTITIDALNPWPTPSSSAQGSGQATTFRTAINPSATQGFATTFSVSRAPSPTSSPTVTSTVTTTMSMSPGVPVPTPSFSTTEEVFDFARVAVLYILQEDSLPDAETAQVHLQKFFSTSGISVEAARNVTVGGGRSVDLIDFRVDVGGGRGRVGGI